MKPDLAAIRALADRVTEAWSKATPGPWPVMVWCETNEGGWAAIGPHLKAEEVDGEYEDDAPNGPVEERAMLDAFAIASARTDAPALADAARALADEVEFLNEVKGEYNRHVGDGEWVCGEGPNGVIDGCRKPIKACSEIYACTNCSCRYHRDCAIAHFKTPDGYDAHIRRIEVERDAALARVEELERALKEAQLELVAWSEGFEGYGDTDGALERAALALAGAKP